MFLYGLKKKKNFIKLRKKCNSEFLISKHESNLLVHHLFLCQDLVHLRCSCWTLELLTIQQLIL